MAYTGRCYESVARYIHEFDVFVRAVNPLLIRAYGNNSLRRVKTNGADSLQITRCALDHWAELRQYTFMDTVRYERKLLNRQLDLYTKTKIPLSNNLIALLEQSFPGVNLRFKSPARKDESQKRADFVGTFSYTESDGSPYSSRNFLVPFSVFATVVSLSIKLLLNSAIFSKIFLFYRSRKN